MLTGTSHLYDGYSPIRLLARPFSTLDSFTLLQNERHLCVLKNGIICYSLCIYSQMEGHTNTKNLFS